MYLSMRPINARAWWCLLSLLNLGNVDSFNGYSGLYLPNTNYSAENYAASWLISRLKFFNAKYIFRETMHLEHISLHLTSKLLNENCETLMTRDFLDFHVEHLSSSSNFVLENNFLPKFIEQMRVKVRELKRSALFDSGDRKDSRQTHATIAIIPFHLNRVQKRGPGFLDKALDAELRVLFLEATFWSTYRYFRNVVIGVCSNEYLNLLRNLQLPTFAVIDMSDSFYYKGVKIADTKMLPRGLLLRIIEIMKFHPDWQVFRYVFYTEADQVVYARGLNFLYDAIDSNRAHHVVVPHRMQVLSSLGEKENTYLLSYCYCCVQFTDFPYTFGLYRYVGCSSSNQ